MALLNITAEEIVRVTSWWVTAPGTKLPTGEEIPSVRPALESLPLLAPMLPLLEEVYKELQGLSRQGVVLPPEVIEIEKKLKEIDPRHDALCRFISHLIDLLMDIVPEGERIRLLALQKKLFPHGLVVVGWSPSREAGAVLRMQGRVTDEDRAVLGAMKLSYHGLLPESGLAALDELIEKGKQLGALEDQKTLLLRNMQAPEVQTERARINRWMNLVTTMRQLLKLSDVSDEVEEKILGSLRATEAAADARVAAQVKPAVPSPVDAPTDNGKADP